MNPNIQATIDLLQSKVDGLQTTILLLRELDDGEEPAGRTRQKRHKMRGNSPAASPSPSAAGNGAGGGRAERQERYVVAIGKLGEEFSTKDFGSLYPDIENPTSVLTGLAKKNLIRKFGRGIWTTRQAIGEKINRATARKPKREDLPAAPLADYKQRKRELGLAVDKKTDDD